MIAKTGSKFTSPLVSTDLRTYVTTLIGVMPWKFLLALTLMVFFSFMEGVGLLMLVPLLQLVGLDVGQGALGRIAQFMSSTFTAVGIRPTLITVLTVYVFIVSVHGLLYRWQTTANLTLEYGFVSSLRQRLYRAITSMSWLFFCKSRSSDFTHVLTTELERIGAATYYLLYLFATAIVTTVYILFTLRLSAVMTGIVFVCGGGLMLLLRGKTKVARVAGEELSQAMNGLYAAVTEHLVGMKTAKSYGVQDRHIDVFTDLTEQVKHTYTRAVRNQAEVKYWFDTGSVLVLSFILYTSFEVLAISTAEVVLLLFLFARIMPRFSSLQQSYQSFVNLLPAFARVMEMQARCEAAAEPRPGQAEKVELRHSIRFEKVSFSYEGDDKAPVVCDLNLIIRAGEIAAIVGPSGVGKTTIADLVMGLIMPDRGRVLINETPLSAEQTQSWRSQIGYVAQDTFLFHDTVRANLLWAYPGASDEGMRQALRLAAAEEFVAKFPKKLETVLGDRGILLSGGERQRLALARALLRRPSLLILDEATSNLDSENEKLIQSVIEELRGQMTILVISHRLSTVGVADVIYVLERGCLVESGDWSTLTAKENGRFSALCRAQGVCR